MSQVQWNWKGKIRNVFMSLNSIFFLLLQNPILEILWNSIFLIIKVVFFCCQTTCLVITVELGVAPPLSVPF